MAKVRPRRSSARRNPQALPAVLYKALAPGINGVDLGPMIDQHGLDEDDDEDGYRASVGTNPLANGGAYFTLHESYAVTLAGNRHYARGILVAVLDPVDFTAMCASGGILGDRALGHSYRVQPRAFPEFNAATSPPAGRRGYYPPGSTLPSGTVVPAP